MDASGKNLALFIQERIIAYYTNMTNDQRPYGVPLMQSLGEHMKQHFADEAMRKEEAKNNAQDGLFDEDDKHSYVVSFFFFPNIFFYIY